MLPDTTRSLRRAYRDWIEEQIEEFKDSIPRSELLCIADQVVRELSVTRRGQYQLTEVVLCAAVDRKLFRMLKLPSYRSWAAAQRAQLGPTSEPTSPEPAPPELFGSLPETEPMPEAELPGPVDPPARVEETHELAPFRHTADENPPGLCVVTVGNSRG